MPNIKRTYDDDADKYRGDDATFGGLFTCTADKQESDDEDDVKDDDAMGLSAIGQAAYKVLSEHHGEHHMECWNVTHGKLVGPLRQTPYNMWGKKDISEGLPGADTHDDWFPESFKQIIERTQRWCDITSLGPPDGKFLERFTEAITTVAENNRRLNQSLPDKEKRQVVVRMLFGNIVGMPVNCTAVIEELTKNIPERDDPNMNLLLWVGAWRRNVSWNHSKIIAVDGRFLHNGGHNLWDGHYLKFNPVHDVSMEASGEIAHDGHLFANTMWKYIEYCQDNFMGHIIDKLPDGLEMPKTSHVAVSEFPYGRANEFPPVYVKRVQDEPRPPDCVPMISMGRYGGLYFWARPSDDAMVAMFSAAKDKICMSLQDVGPICIPGTKKAVPGTRWPKEYLEAWGDAIYSRGVDIEIVVSNPNSIPGGLGATEANYGNGWTCVDVAAEIIGAIGDLYGDQVSDHQLRTCVQENLRVCYLRQWSGCSQVGEGKVGKFQPTPSYPEGMNQGNHAKFFMIDDSTYYVGSQNLYVCDLAEWGIVIDDKAMTDKVKREYWNPIWANSYKPNEDCNVDEVMDAKDIDRNETDEHLADEHADLAKHGHVNKPSPDSKFHGPDTKKEKRKKR